MKWAERAGQRLKPRDLHIFVVVAESRSMAKAAERLAISRPVVSRAIGDLERLLAVTLLDRSPHGVELTAYGEALIRHSIAVFDALRQGVEEVGFLADPAKGLLRVGVSEVPAAGLVPTAIDRLTMQFPRIGVETQQGNVHAVIEHLKARRCELAVVRTTGDDTELVAEPLYHEPMFVVAGRTSGWAKRTRVTLKDLAKERWILARTEVERDGPAWRAFHAAGVDVPAAAIVSDSMNLRHSLLNTGRYITLIPGSALHYGPGCRHVAVLPIALERWVEPTCIVTLRARTVSPIAAAFMNTLRELARPLEKPIKLARC